jgi:hypothetical protein
MTWASACRSARLCLVDSCIQVIPSADLLSQLGYSVSQIENRDYAQTEFFVTDDDGYSHGFGVATNQNG